MTRIIENELTIEDIMGGAALSMTGNAIFDWSEHQKNFAIRTIGNKNNPKGGIIFISNSEFQRISQQQQIFWLSACVDVEDFLARF